MVQLPRGFLMPKVTTFTRYPLETSNRSPAGVWALTGLAAAAVVVLWMMAASAANDDGVVRFGNWTVHKNAQATADGSRCYAAHQRYGTIRLHNSGLYILLPEPPRGYRFWIDSSSPSGMRFASLAEQQTESLDLAGNAFAELQTGRRLRMEIVTYTKVLEVDLDLAGIAEAIAFLAEDPACGR